MNQQNNGSSWIKKNTVALLFGAAVLLLVLAAAFLPMNAASDGEIPSQEVGAGDENRVVDGAELMQTLTYTRCEHVVTRRVTAPVELYGKTLEEVEPLYPEWQITEFAPSQISMVRRPDLFCPDHVVLMSDPSGKLCVYRNKYGDAMALEKELDTEVKSLPAAVQEELEAGVGFSSDLELTNWLESVES
ncbi:MAG: hypothetical protein E7319_06785 [Clostridiales bacterium]|nr:hypothetical protein [Clostridiales bacterium]